MAKLKIKKGDQVIVTTGRDKGKKGEVLRTLPSEARVVVSGVNIVKRHQKPDRMNSGGIVQKEAPIHVSNVAIVDPKSGAASRIGFKKLENGEKVRIAKKSGEVLA
ncbi:MAG: 50S ribosomal protein L24 [Proteobacteria bacterium]|nr:50S ribosomal protein L24 [Pseudomonadota bacterium]